MITKVNYLNNMSCGLAHEMVTCFYNFCLMEMREKNLPHVGTNSNMDAFLL